MPIAGPRPVTQDAGQKKLYYVAAGGMLCLVLIALAVVFVLPERLDRDGAAQTADAPKIPNPPAEARSSPDAPVPSPGADKPETDALRLAAEERLAAALRRQAALESDGAAIWGRDKFDTSFPDVLESLGAANREFDAANYAAAAAGLDRAIALMDTLTNSKPARYEDALAAGRQALADENAERAEAAFRVAVALNPTDPVAEIGLARARSLPEVLERMREGRNREAAGDVDAAHTAYRHAATLDPAHEAAVAAAARTEGIIADRDYRNAVTMALKAIDGRRFGQAAAAISAARRLRPDAPEVRDLAARLQQERQFASISALRGRAEAAERSEDWAAAAERYGEILAIDPSVSVAVTGRKRALDMRDLHARIDIYLDDPDRLSSDAPLERAGRVLAAANGISSAGVRLREKTARLEVLIASASRPRDVVLRSDGETAVTVYRVARFGKLTRRRLSLRPGKYTAVGTRPGYRDVRIEFRVPSSDAGTTVVVQCTERI